MAVFIPHDVLLQLILPRLPAKCVGRCMCVSKEFHQFLSSDVFKKMHIRHLDSHQNPEKFLAVLFKGYNHRDDPTTLATIDCETPDNLIPRSLKAPMGRAKGISGITYLTSFHGLVCLRIILLRKNYIGNYTSERKNDSELILWNPLTSDYKKLSKPDTHKEIHWESTIRLFYSSCEDDYKLASIISHNNVHMYSLKSDSWRRIAFQDTPELKRYQLSQGTCLNENLYFLNDADKYSVTKFDTKTETFTHMKIPLLDDAEKAYHATLMVQKGCIHVFVMYDVVKKHHTVHLIELWKINEEVNWKKMETYVVDEYRMGDMKPLHLSRNENMLMLGFTSKSNFNEYYDNQGYIYNIDLKKNKLKKKKPWKGIGKGTEKLLPVAKMRISQIVRYIETFVSPNQYMPNSMDHHMR